jgi:hypothetical protein
LLLSWKAEIARRRSAPEPEGVLQITELPANHLVNIKAVGPTLEASETSWTGKPLANKIIVWDALDGTSAGENIKIAGGVYDTRKLAVFILTDSALNLFE